MTPRFTGASQTRPPVRLLLTLADLAHFDRLLQAHLDGIEVAREVGWALALPALQRWRGPGEAFVCTWLVLKHQPAAAAERWQALAGVVASDPAGNWGQREIGVRVKFSIIVI